MLLSRLINVFESDGGVLWFVEEVKGGRVGIWMLVLISFVMVI